MIYLPVSSKNIRRILGNYFRHYRNSIHPTAVTKGNSKYVRLDNDELPTLSMHDVFLPCRFTLAITHQAATLFFYTIFFLGLRKNAAFSSIKICGNQQHSKPDGSEHQFFLSSSNQQSIIDCQWRWENYFKPTEILAVVCTANATDNQ